MKVSKVLRIEPTQLHNKRFTAFVMEDDRTAAILEDKDGVIYRQCGAMIQAVESGTFRMVDINTIPMYRVLSTTVTGEYQRECEHETNDGKQSQERLENT